MPTYVMAELLKLARRTASDMFPGELLRLPHTATLACLAQHGPLSQRAVSDLLSVDPADLVGVIDALEEHGYVVRARDPQDRRRYALEITEAGRRALHDRRARGERLNETLFAPLSPHELDQLQSLLLRVLAHHDPRFGEPAAGDVTDLTTEPGPAGPR
jgi:DNA-binding MarR family transcriptional regulator